MVKKVDIDSWARKEHFKFYKEFDEPFFGMVFNVEVSGAYEHCKNEGISFFIFYLFASLKAANAVEEFKYRIENDDILLYDTVNASPTISRNNGTFGFSYIDFDNDFEIFYKNAKKEIERVQANTDLVPASDASNTIHISAIPWVKFTGLSHARNYKFKDSIPKISFGKVFEEQGEKQMPVSVHGHHALMDGYHVGLFAEYFQKELNLKSVLNVKANS